MNAALAAAISNAVTQLRSDQVGKMITSHRGTENFDVSPMDPSRVLRFVEWLAKELEQVL